MSDPKKALFERVGFADVTLTTSVLLPWNSSQSPKSPTIILTYMYRKKVLMSYAAAYHWGKGGVMWFENRQFLAHSRCRSSSIFSCNFMLVSQLLSLIVAKVEVRNIYKNI